MNRRGFLFGAGATIAIIPAARLMKVTVPKLIVRPWPTLAEVMDRGATIYGLDVGSDVAYSSIWLVNWGKADLTKLYPDA